MDTQTQIDRLIELAIIQRTELKQLVEQLPQLREHLNAEVEKVFEETEPQLRSELEEWTTKQTADKTAALGVALEAKIAELAKSLEVSTQARYNAIIAEREENARLAAEAEAKIAEHAASLPSAVKEIVSAELARFPRAGEIDQLRKEFAEPRGLNPRGKWQAGETYNRLDLVTVNGDSFVSNIDGNKERPSRSATNWTLNAARGMGGGSGFTSLNNVLGDPSAGQIVGSEGGQYVRKTLVAGANITINETASAITIIGDEGQISLQDGTAAAPSLFFTNDTDTGIYRPAANTLGISVSGAQVAYFDANGITTVGAGATFDGSVHAANGNANNPSLSFTGDQDTGFFRHQPNELGIALGGTQYATLTSTTFSITPNLSTSGNLTVSGTGLSSVAGALNVTGALLAHQMAALNMAHEGSSLSQLVSYGADASTYGRLNVTLRKAGTGVGAVTALALTSTDATLAGNLTVSGTGTSTFSGNVGITNPANAYTTLTAPNTASSSFGLRINAGTNTNDRALTVNKADTSTPLFFVNGGGDATLSGNLTVSGGTIGTAAATNLTLAGGSSGASLVLGQGANAGGTFTNKGTGFFTFNGPNFSNPDTGGTVLIYSNDSAAIDKGGSLLFGGSYTGTTQTVFAGLAGRKENATAGNYAGYLQFYTGTQASALEEVARLTSTGNLLLKSDGVDSGNGKLQLATHTTSAGGIGFGTGLSLFTSSASVLDLSVSSGNPTLRFLNGTTVRGGIGTGGTTLSIQSDGGSIILASNSTTALTLDSSQNATFAGKITANGAGSTFKGTATNDSAAAGYVGELISGNDGGGVALTTGTRTNIASISLTAGDWDVTGYVGYLPSGGAASTYQEGSISSTSATIGAAGARTILYTSTTAQIELPLPTVRVSLASTTTYYLVSLNTFTGGTMSGTGIIRARRVR